MSKTQFMKRYHSGEFRDLMKMYSFDRHVATHRTQSWADTKDIQLSDGSKKTVVLGVSEAVTRRA